MALTNIGALWRPKKPNAKYKLQGTIEVGGQKLSVLIFPNDKKGNDRAPDYRIVQMSDGQASDV